MLHARNGRGDRGRAQGLLEAARTTYRELGMETYAAPVAAGARNIGTTA